MWLKLKGGGGLSFSMNLMNRKLFYNRFLNLCQITTQNLLLKISIIVSIQNLAIFPFTKRLAIQAYNGSGFKFLMFGIPFSHS